MGSKLAKNEPTYIWNHITINGMNHIRKQIDHPSETIDVCYYCDKVITRETGTWNFYMGVGYGSCKPCADEFNFWNIKNAK